MISLGMIVTFLELLNKVKMDSMRLNNVELTRLNAEKSLILVSKLFPHEENSALVPPMI